MTDSAKGSLFFWVTLVGGASLFLALVTSPLVRPKPRRATFPLQRGEQRLEVQARVRSIGGWTVLRTACDLLLTNDARTFIWRPSLLAQEPSPNSLPPALAALKPRLGEGYADPGEPPMMMIHLFGAPGSGVPYYAVWVICGPTTPDFIRRLNGTDEIIAQLADSVFETYER